MGETNDGSCHIYTPGDSKLQIHSKETQFLGEVDLGFRCKFRELDDFDGNGLIGVTDSKTLKCADDLTFDFNSCSVHSLNVSGFTSTSTNVQFTGASISPDAIAAANPSGGYANINQEIDALTQTATTAKSRTEGLTGGKLLIASGGGFVSSSSFAPSDLIQSGNVNQQTLAGDINLASGKRIKYDGVAVEISSVEKLDKDFGNIPNDSILPEANVHSSIARLLAVNTSLAGKADKTGVVFTGDVSLNTSAITANKVLTVDGTKKIVTSADNLVTDAQVTKINNCPANTTTALADKAPTESPTLTGTVTIPSSLHGTGKFLSVDNNGVITSSVPPDTNTQYDSTDFVDLSSSQSVGGQKTFTSIPKIPTSLFGSGKFLSVDSNGTITSAVPPDTDTNTQYDSTDFVDLSSNQSVGGVKTFSSIPKIPTSLHGTGKFLSVDSNGAITSSVPPDTNTQADLSNLMSKDFSNATGTIADGRIPTNITRDDEVNSATNTQLNNKMNKNADNINGTIPEANIHASIARLADVVSKTADNQTIACNNFSFSSGTSGDLTVTLKSDTDNSNEGDNPRLVFEQDGAGVVGQIAMDSNNDFNFDGSTSSITNTNVVCGSGAKQRFKVGTSTKFEIQGTKNLSSQDLEVSGALSVTGSITFPTALGGQDKFLRVNSSSGVVEGAEVFPLIGQANNDTLLILSAGGGGNNTNIWRIDANNNSASMGTNQHYGFRLQYNGASSGNDNSLSLFADNQGSTDKEVYEVNQDGKMTVKQDLTLNGDLYLSDSWVTIGTSGGNISTGSGYQSKFFEEPLQYMKRGNQVFLRGVIGVTSTGTIANNTVILEINNSGYYPTRSQSYPVACHDSNGVGSAIQGIVTVNASGTNDNKIVFYDDTSDASNAGTVDIHGFYWLN